MKNLNRKSSWRKIIRENSRPFLSWLKTSDIRFCTFDKFASDLERYLFHVLTSSYYGENRVKENCETFASNLPKVLARCDEDIYDEPLVADAYAYVHLLDRYRRFWDVLIELTKRNILPMRDTGIEVLDVGTGPAPALFAVEDFYRAPGWLTNLTIRRVAHPPKLWYDSSQNLLGRLPCLMG